MAAESVKKKQITKRKPPADKSKVFDLVVNKGLSQTDAAKIVNVKPNRISQILQEVKEDDAFLAFTENKDKVFENLQYRLINLADDDLLKSMLSKRGFTDTAILQDKISLLRGQATEIHEVNIRALIATIPVIQDDSSTKQGIEQDTEVIDIRDDIKKV